MPVASVASIAIGGVLGDLIGIRLVHLAATVIVLVAAATAALIFRGASRASGAAAVPAEAS